MAYNGPRLQPNKTATLKLNQFYLDSLVGATAPKIYIREIDGRIVPKSAEGTDEIELSPGSHTLLLEGFYPSSQPGFRSEYIGEATVFFNAEAGHKYVFNCNYRASGNGFLRGTVEDSSADFMVVYPQKTTPKPFSLSEVPKGKAVVCFYREWKFLSGAVDFYVSEKNRDIKILANGTLFYHITTPGSHNYSIGFSGKGQTIHVELLPGVVTYLRASVYSGQLSLVKEAEALKEIKGLELQ